MSSRKPTDDGFARLRARAEALLAEGSRSDRRELPSDLEELLSELEVHQVELELQNQELRKAQEELTRAQARYQDLFEDAPFGYLTLDAKGVVLQANITAATLLGVSIRQLIGRPLSDRVAPEAQDAYHLHRTALLDGRGPGPTRLILRRGDSGSFPAQIHSTRLVGGEEAWRLAMVDVSEQMRLEEELQRSRRFEAIGTLAGGIAHDFNNLLAIVLGNVDLIEEDLPEDSPCIQGLEAVQQAVERARQLVENLLVFSRKSVGESRVFDLNREVRAVTDLLALTRPAGIEIHTDLAEVPCSVEGDRSQLQQVVMNLAMNALQALEGGGTLTVGLHPCQEPPADAPVPESSGPHGWLELRVEDTGSGMDEATLGHMFDPYFTSRSTGKGTGLGLSVVQGAVGSHGGTILAESLPGRGSCFRVFLPTADPSATTSPGLASEPVDRGS